MMLTQVPVWGGLLFSGIGSAALAATATIVAVVVTVRHEARLHEVDRFTDAIAAAYAEAQGLSFALHTNGPGDPEAYKYLKAALQPVTYAMSQAQRFEPELAQLLEDAALDLADAASQLSDDPTTHEAIKASSLRLASCLGRWVTDPDSIRHNVLDYQAVHRLVAEADQNGARRATQRFAVTRWQRLARRMRHWPPRRG